MCALFNLYAFYVECLEIVGLLGFSRGATKLEFRNLKEMNEYVEGGVFQLFFLSFRLSYL